MTDSNYTAIALLVDRSGSMFSIRTAAERSINEFIKGQAKAPGRRTIRIGSFDYEYRSNPSTDARNILPFELHPRGGTALLDAMVKMIDDFGAELAAMPEASRPANVVLAVMTDGEENSSWEYTYRDVEQRVTRQRETYGWEILYLGANQDAIATAARMGVPRHSSMTYAASDVGTRSAVSTMDCYVAAASAGNAPSISDDDREKAMTP